MTQAQQRTDAHLWKEYRETPTPPLREAIVARYLPLVRFVAGRMAVTPPPGLDYEDIYSFGILGLLDAIDRFDLSRGFSFQTFAVPRIRGAILDELRKYDWISRTGREKLQRLERATEKLLQAHGRAEDRLLMRELGMDDTAYRELLDVASRSYVVSLDEVVPMEDGDVERGASLPDDALSAQALLEQEDELRMVVGALEKLPERERLLLSLYYGNGLTLKEIGAVLGVTESRVSQLHGKALAYLRGILATF